MRLSIAALSLTILAASCSSAILPSPYLDIDSAWRETASFTYQPDEPADYWKSPSEFLADNGGDCEDFSTYFLHLVGPDAGASLAVLYLPGRGFHAVVQLPDGRLIEPQSYGYGWSGGSPLWTLSYDTVMALAGANHKALDNGDELIDNGITREMIAACE